MSKFFYCGLQVGFSSKPVVDKDAELFYLSLGNIRSFDFSVCLGNCVNSFETLSELVDYITDYYWRSPFDYIGLASYWEKLTKINQYPCKDFCGDYSSTIPLRSFLVRATDSAEFIQ